MPRPDIESAMFELQENMATLSATLSGVVTTLVNDGWSEDHARAIVLHLLLRGTQ